MTDNERIAEWQGWEKQECERNLYNWKAPDDIYEYAVPDFDTDIGLWHGPDGLLYEIATREMGGRFIRLLAKERGENSHREILGWKTAFGLRCAGPAQLTAALVKMIEEAP